MLFKIWNRIRKSTTITYGSRRYAYRNLYGRKWSIKSRKNSKKSGTEAAKIQIAMAQLYLYHATDIISQKGKRELLLLQKEMNNV